MLIRSESLINHTLVDLTKCLPPTVVYLLDRLLELPWITDVDICLAGRQFGCVVYHEYPLGVKIEPQVHHVVSELLSDGIELQLEVVRGRFGHRPQLQREIDAGQHGWQEYLKALVLEACSHGLGGILDQSVSTDETSERG